MTRRKSESTNTESPPPNTQITAAKIALFGTLGAALIAGVFTLFSPSIQERLKVKAEDMKKEPPKQDQSLKDGTPRTPVAIYRGQESTLVDISDYRFPFNVKEVDTFDAVSTAQADWRFTTPVPGVYEVDAAFTSSYAMPDNNPKISCQIVIVPKGATLRQGHPEVHSFEPHCEARETVSLHACFG